MKKIKKFKIHFRSREIARMLKATAQLTEVTPQLEEAILREAARLTPLVMTAAMYETQAKEKFPAALVSAPPNSWVAASAYIVTIGTVFEEEIRAARQRDEVMVTNILHAIAVEGLDQAANFVFRLIIDEAKDQDCEISRQQMIPSAAWDALFALVPGDKIGVSRAGTDAFLPLYSSCGMVYWQPVKKKRK
ncbi:MAG: hypothetical protein ABSH12_03480 [Endomicrobiales bacterium]|jgi:hypothetical protein